MRTSRAEGGRDSGLPWEDVESGRQKRGKPVQLAQPGFIRDGTWGVSVRRIESEEPSTRRKSGHEPAPFGTTRHKIDPYM